MIATTTRPTHRPARRPLTDELPVDHGVVVRRWAASHIASGQRDTRRILSEALAAAQLYADQLAIARLRFLLDAALRPGMTEDDVLFEARVLLEMGGAGIVAQGVARDMCVAMLEGWAQRQQLTAGGVR